MESFNTFFFVFISAVFYLLTNSIIPINAATITLASKYNITAMYTFGDSILDAGNNNALLTLARSDHKPYGRDFPGNVATGRFTNGKLATDILASLLGLKQVLPAYLDPETTPLDLLTGVSFASAASGYDDITARRVNVLSMKKEVELFEECLIRIRKDVGVEKGNHIVENAMYIIAGGTNDVMYNFYMLSTRKPMLTLSGYHNYLLLNLEGYLRKLYNMGGRNFGVLGLPPVGCLPMQVTMGSLFPGPQLLHRVCIDHLNVDSQKYNAKLRALLTSSQKALPGSSFCYIDAYKYLMDMISNPAKYGFEHTLEGCCGTGMLEMAYTCNEIKPSCKNASKYVFFDSVHPTEAAYRILANSFLRDLLPILQSRT